MKLGSLSRISEDLPVLVELLRYLVGLDEVLGYRGAWVLDLLEAVGEGEECHGTIGVESVVAMRPTDGPSDASRF